MIRRTREVVTPTVKANDKKKEEEVVLEDVVVDEEEVVEEDVVVDEEEVVEEDVVVDEEEVVEEDVVVEDEEEVVEEKPKTTRKQSKSKKTEKLVKEEENNEKEKIDLTPNNENLRNLLDFKKRAPSRKMIARDKLLKLTLDTLEEEEQVTISKAALELIIRTFEKVTKEKIDEGFSTRFIGLMSSEERNGRVFNKNPLSDYATYVGSNKVYYMNERYTKPDKYRGLRSKDKTKFVATHKFNYETNEFEKLKKKYTFDI